MDGSMQAKLCALLFFIAGHTIYFGKCASTSNSDGDTFSIQHLSSGKCLQAELSGVGLSDCSDSPALRWKWGFDQLLFHVATARCLGLDAGPKALGLFACDSVTERLRWRCSNGAIQTSHQMALSVAGLAVSAKADSKPDSWRRAGSEENICQQPYQIIHTMGGNANGGPCVLPFLFNGSWHHGCLPSRDKAAPLAWCSTTSDYDMDRKWGNCLRYEEGCAGLFDGPKDGPCYEYISNVAATWHEARDACRSQGADLLSLSSAEESYFQSNHIGRTLPDKMWIGLHQLDMAQGWQWSDGTPLSFIHWEKGMPSTSILREADCGLMNSDLFFENEACDRKLPYICEKNRNDTHSQATDSLVYKTTVCEKGWTPWNLFCYRLVKEARLDFEKAQQYCEKSGAGLVSVHSLDIVEMISTEFYADATLEMWIGLKSQGSPAHFQWVDNSTVCFTYWAKNQPEQPPENTTACVFQSGRSQGWKVSECGMERAFLCRKKGEENSTALEAGCPSGEDWKRHGNACYKVDLKAVPYKEKCDVIIRNRFEQAFINSLLREHISTKTRYFWIGLQDVNGDGEYQWVTNQQSDERVTFTNWAGFQPDMAGGCAVLSTSKPLGRWEVRNCSLFEAGTICKRDIGPVLPPESEPDPAQPCPLGWVSKPDSHYCYKVFHDERLSRKRSWEEAERFCQALGAHLPSFSHAEEMRVLHSVMRDSISDDRFFWVGLNRRNPASEKAWEWSDGRPVSTAIFPQEFHEGDMYNRDCLAFKTLKRSRNTFLLLIHYFPLRPFYGTPFHCDARMEWVCQIPKGKTPNIPLWYNPGGHHNSSIFVDSKEFWFITEPMLTYKEADLYCASNDSKLASPESFNAVRQIVAQLNTVELSGRRPGWWVDMQSLDHFFPMTLMQMRRIQASFLGRCTSLGPGDFHPDYSDCERRMPFVCERFNITSVEKHPLEPLPAGLPCDQGATSFRDKCYIRLFKPLYLKFKSAGENCQSLKGTLLSITDQVEQDFITTLLPDQPEKSWIGLKLKSHDILWEDKSPVTFLNFNPLVHGQLRPMTFNSMDPDDLEQCAYILKGPSSDIMGTWDYTSCLDMQYVSICQHDADKAEAPLASEEIFQVGNHTFKMLLRNVTWLEAMELCRSEGMDLASVSSTFLQAVLTVNVSRANTSMWIGLFSEDDGVHYRWTDHSHTVFSRWFSEPTSGRCVYLDTDGFWKATECEEVLGGAICHIPLEEHGSMPEDIAVKCPHRSSGPNWIPFKKNCYTFQLVSSRWNEFNGGHIRDTCKKLDPEADILTIRNQTENEFVKQQLVPFKDLVQYVWLGMFNDLNVDRLKWYDGTNVQYSNWKEGRPNITEQFMAGLNLDGLWEIFTYQEFFKYFKQRSIVACKIEKGPKDEFNRSASDYERYGNRSYHVIKKKLTWYQALGECARSGAHLASVHDAAHDAHFQLVAKSDGFPLWIGLSSHDATASSYEWSDGTRYDFSPGEFVSSKNNGRCVYMKPSGSWEKMTCQSQVDGALCYNSTSPRFSSRSDLGSSKCPQSDGTSAWVQHREHCYAFDMKFYNYSVFTMEHATSVCEKLDASSRLLTIENKEENDFVSDYMTQYPLVTSRVWLGMDLDMSGHPLGWLDGTNLDFSNWEAGSVEQGHGLVCAVMVTADGGSWKRVSCKEGESRVVCKAPVRSGGLPVALGLFIVVLLATLGAGAFIVYKRNRSRFVSTVRYKRNFDEVDSTSIIADTE